MTLPRLHVVTDDETLARADFVEVATEVLEAAGHAAALHVRGPRTDGRRLYELVAFLGAAARGGGTLLVVNDRVDVAMAAGLTAVQLGRRSLSVAGTRGIMPEARIGASCHDAVEVAEATGAGAAWVVLGNVFETASHPGRPGLGLAGLTELSAAAGAVPTIAIGGVQTDRVTAVLRAGAWGVAVRSGIWDAGSPRAATSEYISVLQAEAEGT